ncbi:hypothetical protein OsJ_34266 [Oryza sativa Japonica Group]|uniref:DUF6598 domain-containing protein n=1 Tax=Oryza sativa subsp. japonica TaxID=39947 RepID=A3CCD1_ORYSJ|nr:hypothetical protein OsJ_34266 [Oryza sativa Japonica Group]
MAAETSVSEAAAILDVAVAGDGKAKRQLVVVVDDDDDDSEPNPVRVPRILRVVVGLLRLQDRRPRGPTFQTAGGPEYPPAWKVYSCRVIDLTGGLEWPIDVFGFVAARDGLDRKRNYIFNRPRDDAQTFTTEDPSFVLTGPIRAINCSQRIEFEVDLKVRGKTQSDRDKVLSARYIVYETMGPNCMVGQVRSKARPGKRCSVEVTFANLAGAVEAAIEVRVVQGSSGFCGRIVARTDGYDDDVVFADSSNDGSVLAVADDGVIKLARSVAVVESTGVLKIHAIIARSDSSGGYDGDPSFVLTGPIRAINCSQRIEFEVDLKVRGKTQSDRDKVLSARYIVYETMGPNCMVGQVRSKARPGKRCSVEVTFANLAGAVEAAIEVRVVQGSSGFCGRIVARTDGYDDDVVFADSSNDGSVLAVADDGVIKLARSVAVVESTGVLKIHAIIARSDSSGGYDGVGVAAEDHAEFAAQRFESSCRTLDLGFCKMLATVSWSMIPLI